MRIYSNCVEAAKEIERDLIEMGTEVQSSTMQDIDVRDNPDFMTKELIGYHYMITDPSLSLKEWEDYFKLNRGWLEEEFIERIDEGGLNPGTAWAMRKDTWSPFIHQGKFAYTYSERVSYQITKVISELNRNPSTRQAVVDVYQGILDSERLGGKQRVPCSMYYQFFRRKLRSLGNVERLHMVYTMRSCDFYLHFPYDVSLAIRLGEYIAWHLNIELGSFQQYIGSLHAYKRDYKNKGIF